MLSINLKLINLLLLFVLFGCSTQKILIENENISPNLYPIGENGKWGFVNSDGLISIKPVYENAEVFSFGLALVKYKGKIGYLNGRGNWQIKPKYDSGTSFVGDCATVSFKGDTFNITRLGRKSVKFGIRHNKVVNCTYFYACGAGQEPADPNGVFKFENGLYKFGYRYVVKIDSINFELIKDTLRLSFDKALKFGLEMILLEKNGKFGIFNIRENNEIFIDLPFKTNHQELARNIILNSIDYKYDDVVFELFLNEAVTEAKVRIGDKYGVISDDGSVLIPIEYKSLEINPFAYKMALVEYEKNKFGYKRFDGKEFFRRNITYLKK